MEVTPSRSKRWRFKYRIDNKEKLISLGIYPDVSLKDAQERRDEPRKLLANQIDPSENRKAIKSSRALQLSNCFEAIAREWWKKFSTDWSDEHKLRVLRRFENTINAALRAMGISKEEMCGHGFRVMARTILDEVLNIRPDYIEHQLAHAVKDPNGRAYNRTTHLGERRKMMQQWADYLDGIKTR